MGIADDIEIDALLEKYEIKGGQMKEKEKKDMGIVEETQRAALEVDLAKQRKETQEGVAADTKLKELQKGEEQKRQEVGNKFLDGMPYELERVVGETKAFLQQTVTGLIEIGKRLIAIKEYEKHGEWEKIVEGKIGISRATAWRFMAIARKFNNCFTVKQMALGAGRDGIGKLYALLNITDEELTEFDETGMFRGATVDDINKMSVKDIRKLIAEKEDWKAKYKQLELSAKYDTHKQWNEKITKKDMEVKRLQEQLKDKELPLNDREAIAKIQNLRTQLCGVIRLLESADIKKYSEEVKEEWLLAAQYAHDRGELFLGRVLDELKHDRPALEEAEANFTDRWEKEDA